MAHEGAFAGKKALITGGSSGIGLALTRQLAAAGADTWMLARGQERLALAESMVLDARADERQTVRALSADVADPDAMHSVAQAFMSEAGPPDLIINSAGVARPGYVQELPLDVFHEMMDINYFGTVHTVHAFLPDMIARGQGHIVNLASVAGFLGVFGYTAYGASKFAVRGYSDVLRAELKPLGLHVSIVFPPDVQTPQLEYEAQFKPAETKALAGSVDPISADSAAEAILTGIARRRYLIIPGLESKVIFWLTGLLGSAVYPLMDWMVASAIKNKEKAGGQ